MSSWRDKIRNLPLADHLLVALRIATVARDVFATSAAGKVSPEEIAGVMLIKPLLEGMIARINSEDLHLAFDKQAGKAFRVVHHLAPCPDRNDDSWFGVGSYKDVDVRTLSNQTAAYAARSMAAAFASSSAVA